MASQDTDHALIGGDDPFLAQFAGAGHASSRSRLTAQTTRPNLGLGVKDLLIADFTDHAAAAIQSTQGFGQIHRPIDLNGTGNSRSTDLLGIQFTVVIFDDLLSRLATFPTQMSLSEQPKEGIGSGSVDSRQAWQALE